VKRPHIKTINQQVDHIEASTAATEARLVSIEKLLQRITAQLETKTN
jgi:hypothetical protein